MKRIYIPLTIVLTTVACYFADRFIEHPTEYTPIPAQEDIILEFTKDSHPMPAIKVGNNSSIHIITDDKDRLIDVQIIDLSGSGTSDPYCTYSLISKKL